MSSFFTVPASQRKRKRTEDRASKPSKRRATPPDDGPRRTSKRNSRAEYEDRDSSVSSQDSESGPEPELESDEEGTSEEDESPEDRRIRLAQNYLNNLKGEVDEAGFDAEEIDKDLIAQRLKEDADEARGRQYRLIANSLDFAHASHCAFRSDTHTTTGVATCPPFAYTVSKDKCLIKWELIPPPSTESKLASGTKKPAPPRRRPKQLRFRRGVKIDASVPQQNGHTGAILAVAASPDGRYVVTGGMDKRIIVWSAEELRPLKTFLSHRDVVTGLSFAPTSSQPGAGAQLFSASKDRTLKTYSLNGDDSLAYVETLFGHQDHVVDIAAMAVDQCVSVGARDRTARLWKVVDETQLVFRADSSRSEPYQTGSVDCVAALPPAHFVTGSDSGALCLWSVYKKKALFTIPTAHGVDEPPPMESVTSEHDSTVIDQLKKDDTRRPYPRAITALTSLPGTDVVLSGSWDGWIRAWKVADDKRSILSLGPIGHVMDDRAPMNGTVDTATANGAINGTTHRDPDVRLRGVVSSISVFERRKQIVSEFGGMKEGECEGLCLVAGTGKERRLGRWEQFGTGKNGATVFEVPLRS